MAGSLFESLRSKIVHSKIFYQRALGYVALVNSSMILFLLLSSLEKYGVDINIKDWFFPIIILSAIALVIVGYIEDRLGFYRAEQQATTRRNPQMQAIHEKLDRIEKELKSLKKQKTKQKD